MQMNSIKRRIDTLENAKGGVEDIRIMVLEQLPEDDPHYKECSEYIISRCKSVCNSETFDNALGAAFIALTGENPLNKKGITIIDISDSVATELVDILTSRGIEVKL